MFTLVNKIENIIYYTLNERFLVLKDKKLNFIFNNQVIAQNINDDLILTDDKVFYNNLDGFTTYDLKNDTLNNKNAFSILNTKPMSNQLGVIIRNIDEQLFVFDKIKLEKTKLTIENYNWGLIFCSDEYLFIQDIDVIQCYSIKQNLICWQFNLNQLNFSTNSDNEVLNYKVIKFLGVWQNELFIAFNNGLMVALDKNTGKENRKWQYIKGYEFDSEIKNKIPRAESFVFDGDTLIGALNTFYFKIDLKSSKIIAINISQELQKFNIFHIKTVSDNPVTNKHIYLTAMMRQKEGDTKFSYDCLIALNKKTLEIDWHYTFEDAGLGTNIPKLSGNKLYQLDNNQTLHIFEKTTNKLS